VTFSSGVEDQSKLSIWERRHAAESLNVDRNVKSVHHNQLDRDLLGAIE
jgi:hypothetical protein